MRIGGVDVSRLPSYKREVNTVFQSYALFPHLTVGENVAYGLKQRGLGRRERRARASEMLELVQLSGLDSRKPRQLSGGQQQRVALARALVMNPRVLLLDEPLGALDLKVRRELQIELKRIQADVGITFVYVTHDQEEALAMSDRVAVMNAGRIEQLGAPGEIYDRPATRFVADFIGETNFIRQVDGIVAVRPERVRLTREAPTAERSLGVTVVATMVVGPAVQCVVRTEDGQEVLVREQRAKGDNGSRVATRRRAGVRQLGRRRGSGTRSDGGGVMRESFWNRPVDRKGFIASSAFAALAAASGGRLTGSAFGAAEQQGGTLHYYNWAAYVNPKTYADFTKATGIKVKKSFYTSNETMLAKLNAGARGYDLAVPTEYMVRILIEEDLLEKIDLRKLPNVRKNIDPKFFGLPYDARNEWSIPKDWGTTGFVYRKDLIKEQPRTWKAVLRALQEIPEAIHDPRRQPRDSRLGADDDGLLVQLRLGKRARQGQEVLGRPEAVRPLDRLGEPQAEDHRR